MQVHMQQGLPYFSPCLQDRSPTVRHRDSHSELISPYWEYRGTLLVFAVPMFHNEFDMVGLFILQPPRISIAKFTTNQRNPFRGVLKS